MNQDIQKFKYEKHSEKQYLFILSAAERLFVERGIEKVKLSDIASECGIMRATLYRYFKDKDELLWHIMRKNTLSFSEKLKERVRGSNGTTFDRFKIFMDILCEGFETDTNLFLFIDMFNDTYQNVTSDKNNVIYDKIFKADDFRTGDTVRFFAENFHDGSVKAGLDPLITSVTLTYSAIIIVAGISKQTETLPVKYAVAPREIVKFSLNALLESIRA
jgi:Transcriptional regulator